MGIPESSIMKPPGGFFYFPFGGLLDFTFAKSSRKGDRVMATRKMKITIWGFIGILVIAAWLLGSVTQSGAETMKYRLSTYIVHFEVLPIRDTEGHIVATFSRKGLAFFENGEVGTFTNWGTLDFIKGKGSFQYYNIITHEDGSATMAKGEGTAEPSPKGLSLYKGTAEFIKGTGRFEGIKGNATFSGKGMTPFSKEKGLLADAYFDVTATYTLPPK